MLLPKVGFDTAENEPFEDFHKGQLFARKYYMYSSVGAQDGELAFSRIFTRPAPKKLLRCEHRCQRHSPVRPGGIPCPACVFDIPRRAYPPAFLPAAQALEASLSTASKPMFCNPTFICQHSIRSSSIRFKHFCTTPELNILASIDEKQPVLLKCQRLI